MTSTAATDFLRRLVSIPSVNPAMTDDPALAGEIRMVDALEILFTEKGFRTERLEVTSGRPNLIARYGSETPRKTILFESHLDTVGVVGFQGNPFTLTEADGRLTGRGACDTKGPLAAFLAALDQDVLTASSQSGLQILWGGGPLGRKPAIWALKK